MASQLASSLLGATDPTQLGVAGTMDPAVLQAMPELQLARTMMQAGLDTSPAHPMQALARVLQAAAGGAVQQGAIGELQKATSGTAEDLSKALPPDHFLQSWLHSPNPTVRAMAVQMAPKAGLLGSEYQKLPPGEELKQPGQATPSAVGAPRFTPEGVPLPQSGAGPAATPLARVLTAAQAQSPGPPQSPAGAPSASTAPIVPNTVRTVPVAPAASFNQRSQAAVGAPTGGLTEQIVRAAAAKAAAEAKAKAPYEAGGEGTVIGPDGVARQVPITAQTRAGMQPGGGSAASATPVGKPLPNPAVEPLVAADTKELEGDRQNAIKGQQDMATVRAVQDFLPKVHTGWSGDTRLEGARILTDLGVPADKVADFTKTDTASGQILQKKFLELSAGAARGMGAREPGSVIQMFAKAYPNLGTDEKAVGLQTNALYMDRLRNQHLADAKTDYLNQSINDYQSSGKYRGLQGFNQTFNKTRPAESYFSAAESMSGFPHAWERVKDPAQQQAIIDLIPGGTKFMAPNGKMLVKPGG
jgi:hypothetical protein